MDSDSCWHGPALRRRWTGPVSYPKVACHPHEQVYSRYRRWQQSGVWTRVRVALGANDETDWARILANGAAIAPPPRVSPEAQDKATKRPAVSQSSSSSRPISGSNGMTNRWPAW